MLTKGCRFSVAFLILASAPARAAAPIYFDLGGLILFALAALLLFVVLLIVVVRTKSRAVRAVSLACLASYILVPVSMNFLAHMVREKGDNWTLFENERYSLSNEGVLKVVELCRTAIEERPREAIKGLRLLAVSNLPDSPARGWPTGVDFFVGGGPHAGQTDAPASVVEALQSSVRKLSGTLRREGREHMPFVEYQSKAGHWKRYSVSGNGTTYTEQDASDIQATHGLRITQIKTGLERQYKIFAGSIEIIDLASGKVVGNHLSYTHDRYWGAHNHYSLFAGEHCTGLPVGVDFLTNWLEPLFTRV